MTLYENTTKFLSESMSLDNEGVCSDFLNRFQIVKTFFN